MLFWYLAWLFAKARHCIVRERQANQESERRDVIGRPATETDDPFCRWLRRFRQTPEDIQR